MPPWLPPPAAYDPDPAAPVAKYDCTMRTPSDVRRGAVVHDVVVPSSPGGPGRRREETVVINLTDLDVRYANHATRIARVGREGWLLDASAPIGSSRLRELAIVVGSMRRRLGGASVGGERLRGTPADHAANPAASRYTLDTVR
jgi:hypothetical protein